MSGRGSLVFTLLGLLLVVLALEATALIGAWVLGFHNMRGQEIEWLESWEPFRVWEPGRHKAIDKLYVDRVRMELTAGRLDRAAGFARLARRRFRDSGRVNDSELLALGVEVATRASDRLERGGRLSAAADWNDSVFVMAVRSSDERMRNAALAAFTEGLELRTRDGQPCAALARVEWARKGLGGEIPNFPEQMQSDLEARCRRARSGER